MELEMSNPAYVRSDNVNSVVYRGSDNQIHEIFLPRGGAAWQSADPDLSAQSGAPPAVGDPGGYVRSDQVNSVVYPFIFNETDNHILEIFLPRGATTWQSADLSGQSGATLRGAAGHPFGYVRSDHVNSVVYRGTDNDIHEIFLPLGATAWQSADLSALSGAPPAI
jgi:hypothetical protein